MPISRLLFLPLSLALFSLPALAQDSPRRVLASCMAKRMVADRTVSYNEAQRACKDLLRGSGVKAQTAAASTQPKPVS